MAIDMSTVKQIIHNNKDVTKIEDSLGNILWQKPQDMVIYYMDNGGSSLSYASVLQKYDFANKTVTSYTILGTDPATSGSNKLQGSWIAYVDNKLLASFQGNATYELTIDDSNQTFSLTPYTWTSGQYYANNSALLPNGVIYQNATANPSATATNTTCQYLDNGSWIGISSGIRPSYNRVFKYNNNYYVVTRTSNASNYLVKWVNNAWEYSTDIPWVNGFTQTWTICEINGTLWYVNGSNSKYYNPSTNQWVADSTTFYPSSTTITGDKLFTIGDRIFYVNGTNILELDITNMTWSLYWTVTDSLRGDYFNNKKGSCQLSQVARPRG